MPTSEIISTVKEFCRSQAKADAVNFSFDQVSIPGSDGNADIAMRVISAANVPGPGIRSSFVINLPDFGWNGVLVIGARGDIDLVTALGTIGAYLLKNPQIASSGNFLKGAFEVECHEQEINFPHVVFCHPFPWKGLEEALGHAGVSLTLFTLPVDERELVELEERGFERFEDFLLDRGRDVFSLQDCFSP